MDHLAVDGVHAEVTGAGSPVVLSHEGLLHSESWDAQVAALAAEHRVARWDRRGYGRSPRPTEASVADLAAVVRAVSDGLHAGVPGATRVVVPGSGHLPHLEAPEAFTRLVCEFLTEG